LFAAAMGKTKEREPQQQQQTSGRPPRRGIGKVGPGAFDVHKVRPKHAVLGRVLQAQETAHGQRRGDAAAANRKATLLLDTRRRVRNAANALVDRRPTAAAAGRGGSRSSAAAAEERMLALWHRERAKKLSNKARRFALGEDDATLGDSLSHMGHTLGEREEDYVDVPEGVEEEADSGAIGDYGEEDARDEGRLRDAAEGPMDIVARAKARKAERAREKAARQELVGTLDEQWGDLAAFVLADRRTKHDGDNGDAAAVVEEVADPEDASAGGAQADDENFERMVRELGAEARGRASDRTKRPDEIEEERAEATGTLERERLRRMADPDDRDNSDIADNDDDDDVRREAARKLRQVSAATKDAGDEVVSVVVPTTAAEWKAVCVALGDPPAHYDRIVRKVYAANHLSLGEHNRAKLEAFLAVLVEEFCDISDPATIDPLARGIAFLGRELGGPSIARVFFDKINKVFQHSAGRSTWPAARELLLLRLVPVIFPASDFRHPVATPTAVLIAACLSRCAFSLDDRNALVAGLFLCATAAAFVQPTGRVIPEALSFLGTALKALGNVSADVVSTAASDPPLLPLPIATDAIAALSQGDFLASALCAALAALSQFARLWASKPSYGLQLLRPLCTLVASLTADGSPWSSNDGVKGFAEEARRACNGIAAAAPLSSPSQPGTAAPKVAFPAFRTVERKNPMPPREFAPRMTDDGQRKLLAAQDPEQRMKKLRAALARERKAVAREVRKDSAFLAAELDHEAEMENAEIKRRTGKIMAMLQDAQHEEKVEKRLREKARKRLKM